MRIAVCLCGQLRTWSRVSSSIKSFFGDSVDFFGHTWTSSSDTLVSKHYDMAVNHTEQEIQNVVAAFGLKDIAVDSMLSTNFIFSSRWSSLFFSVRRCLELVHDYESKTGIQYDIIVKTRYDLAFNPEISFNELLELVGPIQPLPKHIYSAFIGMVADEHDTNNVDDCFFFALGPIYAQIVHDSYIESMLSVAHHQTQPHVIPDIRGDGPGSIIGAVAARSHIIPVDVSKNIHKGPIYKLIRHDIELYPVNLLSHATFIQYGSNST